MTSWESNGDIAVFIDLIEQQQQEIEQFNTVVKSLSFALEAYSGMRADKAMNVLTVIAKSIVS